MSLDPTAFADQLDGSFGHEPPVGDPLADLDRGRGRLRRRRSLVGAGGVGFAAVAASVLLLLPTSGGGADRAVQPASGDAWSDAEVLDRCTHPSSAMDDGGSLGRANDYWALRQALPDPELVTRGDSALGTVATIRGADGKSWGDCDVFLRPTGGIHTSLNVYRTSISFPAQKDAEGRPLYDFYNEADDRVEGSATSTVPSLFTPCRMTEPEDTQAYYDQQARCDRFTVTWNDRRPADVAAVRVKLPTGEVLRADVDHGYLSLGQTFPMTPAMARLIRTQQRISIDDVTFFDADGRQLAHGHGLGDADPGIERFPSLALWLK